MDFCTVTNHGDGGTVHAITATPPFRCCVSRLPNGTPGTSFRGRRRYDNCGLLCSGFGVTNGALAEAADGRFCSAADARVRALCVYRFNDVVRSAPKCSLDIDGDGLINATTDGLICCAMLGFIGHERARQRSCTSGAARTTWGQVRTIFLISVALARPCTVMQPAPGRVNYLAIGEIKALNGQSEPTRKSRISEIWPRPIQ